MTNQPTNRPTDTHTDSPLDVLTARARMRQDTDTLTDWYIRLADWYLAAEPDAERARR